MSELVPEESGLVYQAARYSLLSGGKRLRPIIVLATVEALGGSPDSALNPACALEMVHTYSLIHDDLPSMDNDDFRRGKPTLHKVYPESHAILAGDFLLNYAFEVISDAPYLSSDQKIALVKTLAVAGGGQGMIGGQIMDLESSGKNLSIEALRQIYLQKTSALLETAFAFGGIIAKASHQEMEILKKCGSTIGLAFQIIDDTLDAWSDKQNNKTTYASLLGVEQAQALAHDLHKSALALLSQLPYDTGLLEAIAENMIKRKN